jgi:hypothetical protein
MAEERNLLSQASISRMMAAIERMCGNDFKGRRAGSQEQYKAIDFLASAFSERGLESPQTLNDYRQSLTMRYSLVRSSDEIKATLSYELGGGIKKTKIFTCRQFQGRGGIDLRTQVVFVGYGISDSEAGYDDYAGLDVTGKIVFWLPGKPKGIELKKPVSVAGKTLAAYRRGAVACLTCGIDELGANVGLSNAIADFPCIAVDKAVAKDLLGADAEMPVGRIGRKVRLTVTPICDPDRRTYNIVGNLPGGDPELADEFVMISAHYDHLGDDPSGRIFPGADDNASGVAVLLEAAECIKQSGLTPRRTLVFACWTGEECGLVGSNYFAANPPFPLEKIVSHVNLDMVGAGTPGKFIATGASAFPRQYSFIASSAADLGLALKSDDGIGASDHLALIRKKAPSALICADGEHPNFHTTRDTPSAVDKRVLESAARLALLTIWRAANAAD